MSDTVSPEKRSEIMRSVRSKNTKPEMTIRRLLHRLGYRYRIHARDLPGTPDIAFRARKKAIFVHGCFWHMHRNCRRSSIPASNREYWEKKLNRNRERDREHREALISAGWAVLVVWECEIKNLDLLADRLVEFLGPTRVA
jgi:DNA mismatch endonuclease (patch repair protein)